MIARVDQVAMSVGRPWRADAGRRARRTFAAVNVIISHVGALSALFVAWRYGVRSEHLLIAAMLFVFTTGFGVEVGFHRLFAHHAFDAHPALRWSLGVLGCMAGQGSVIFWAGVHRKHHAHTDQPGDPHSPHLHGNAWRGALAGLWHAHLGWILDGEDYKAATVATDLLRDRIVFGLSRRYVLWVLMGLVLPAGLGLAIEGRGFGALQGLLWGGLTRICVGQHVAWAVNSLGHRWGTRRFDAADNSRNIWWLAVPSFGGSLHNNHHAFPSAASTRRAFWELDLGGIFISSFVAVGLASRPKRPSKQAVAKSSVKGDRLEAAS